MPTPDEPNVPPESSAPKLDLSAASVVERRARLRTLALAGYTTPQIAHELGLSESQCRSLIRRAGVRVLADQVVGRAHRHNATRIMHRIVMDAENLTADVNLVDFAQLDRAQVSTWLGALKQSRDSLGALIRRLMKEQHYGKTG